MSGMDKIAPIAVLRALGRLLKVEFDLRDLEQEAKAFKEQLALTAKYLFKKREEEEEKPKYIY